MQLIRRFLSLGSFYVRLCFSQGPGDSLLRHIAEVFISLFASGSVLCLELTSVKWGEGPVLQQALAAQLPPFLTALQQHRCHRSPVPLCRCDSQSLLGPVLPCPGGCDHTSLAVRQWKSSPWLSVVGPCISDSAVGLACQLPGQQPAGLCWSCPILQIGHNIVTQLPPCSRSHCHFSVHPWLL